MVISSMAQDIIARGGHTSELDTINGYMLSLADKHGVSAPYNRAVYEMCRREFAREKFTPLSIEDVGAEVLRRVQAG
jgi:ketopantoate reductase